MALKTAKTKGHKMSFCESICSPGGSCVLRVHRFCAPFGEVTGSGSLRLLFAPGLDKLVKMRAARSQLF